MLVEYIEQYLGGNNQIKNEEILVAMKDSFDYSVVRQLMETRDGPTGLRGSHPGPCARKMAYGFHEFPVSKDLDSRTKITFLTGDLLELVAVAIIKLSGIGTRATILDGGQEDAYFDVGNGLMIPCHGDGIILAQPGITDEEVLLEIKSVNDRGFKYNWMKLQDVGYQYMLQHQVYLEAYGLKRGLFFAINKNTGHFCEIETEYNPELVEIARNNYTLAGFSDPDNLPPRFEDGKDYGRVVDKSGVKTDRLAWGCMYCSFNTHCWPGMVTTIEKGRPVGRVPDDSVARTETSDWLDI